jgi:hypothetical protein
VLARDLQLTPGLREYLAASASQGPPAYSRAPGVVTVRSGVQAILNSSHSSVTNFSSYYFAMVWVLIES